MVPIQKVEHKHLLPDQKTIHESESKAIASKITSKGRLTPEARTFLELAAQKLALSARSYMKVIRVARTIADLDRSETILKNHMGEALSYRPR